jgi:hypothetical protein
VARCPHPYRPRLEALETRALPSTCTVDLLTDNHLTSGGEGSDGMGDLRWCLIEALFRADTINFPVTGTIHLAGVLPTLARPTRYSLTERKGMFSGTLFQGVTLWLASLSDDG